MGSVFVVVLIGANPVYRWHLFSFPQVRGEEQQLFQMSAPINNNTTSPFFLFLKKNKAMRIKQGKGGILYPAL
jgi:hypothetical protein